MLPKARVKVSPPAREVSDRETKGGAFAVVGVENGVFFFEGVEGDVVVG